MSDNNWIEWKGGQCPVPTGTLVDVMLRDGSVFNNKQAWTISSLTEPDFELDGSSEAGWAFWRNDGEKRDIIAYRLHQPEQAAWNGEGLPPVGCECELFDCEQWNPVRIKYVGDKYVVTDRLDLGYEIVYCVAQRPEKLRPFRTEAARRRESICDAIYGALTKAERKHNRSDEAEALYDAIAAGKIRGVKLL